MKNENEKQNMKLNEKIVNKLKGYWLELTVLFATLLVAIVILSLPEQEIAEDEYVVEFSSVNKICELATLKCYYHNVAEDEQQPDGLFKYGLFQFGYKKMFLEYDGYIEVGIDMNKVVVCNPDENNVVRVYVPEARILNSGTKIDTIQPLVSDVGVFTNITAEDETKMHTIAQQTMRENAQNDENILYQAQMHAKLLLRDYIVNLGKQFDLEYTVEWLSTPPNSEGGND